MRHLPSYVKLFDGLIFVWTLISASVHSEGFSVTGDLSFWESVGTNYVLRQSCTFEADVVGATWLQATHLTNGQHYIQGSDGHSVFWLFVDERERKASNLKYFPGVVCKGPYPLQCTTIFSTLPWLAFCSTGFFSDKDAALPGEIPALWRVALVDPLAHIYKSTWSLIPGSQSLPQQLTFQPDASLISDLKQGKYKSLSFLDNASKDSAIVQAESYYRLIDEPEAVYAVNRTTNFGSLVLPTEFRLDRFSYTFTTNHLSTRHNFGSTRGRITTMEHIFTLDPMPKSFDVVTSLSVADYRFFNRTSLVPFIRYIATNCCWLTNQSDPYLERIYALTASRTERYYSRKTYSRWLIASLFVFALCSPLALSPVRRRIVTIWNSFITKM